MNIIFMNPENSKTSARYRLVLNLTEKINLKVSIYYKNINKTYKINKSKKLELQWEEEFELPDESYSVSDIQNHF